MVFALRAKKELFMLFLPILGNFWCSVVNSVTFSSKLSKLGKNPKKIKKIVNLNKILKNPQIKKKSEKSPKHQKETQKIRIKPNFFGNC